MSLSLRDRQVGGFPLLEKQGWWLIALGSIVVYLTWYFWWLPHFWHVPKVLRGPLSLVCVGMYVHSSLGQVRHSTERIQMFCGRYTGISCPAGLCPLPKLPFPVVSLILWVTLDKEIYAKIGWTLGETIDLASIVINLLVEGMTLDDVRIIVTGVLVFEIHQEGVPTYVAQTQSQGGMEGFRERLHAEVSARIKEYIISKNTVKELEKGSINSGDGLNAMVNQVCQVVDTCGVYLARSPLMGLTIKNPKIQEVFDQIAATSMLDKNVENVARRVQQMMEKNPGMSYEVAYATVIKASGGDGPDIGINTIKVN